MALNDTIDHKLKTGNLLYLGGRQREREKERERERERERKRERGRVSE